MHDSLQDVTICAGTFFMQPMLIRSQGGSGALLRVTEYTIIRYEWKAEPEYYTHLKIMGITSTFRTCKVIQDASSVCGTIIRVDFLNFWVSMIHWVPILTISRIWTFRDGVYVGRRPPHHARGK
jgi:hypothetical protein